MIPDLFDFQTIVPDMEDDADPKAEEAEAPVADASTPTITTSDSNVPQPVMESHVTIPTLVAVSTVIPDLPTETTPEPEAEPVEDTTPSEMPVTAVGTEEEKEPADAQTETEAGNEPATDDAVKTSLRRRVGTRPAPMTRNGSHGSTNAKPRTRLRPRRRRWRLDWLRAVAPPKGISHVSGKSIRKGSEHGTPQHERR